MIKYCHELIMREFAKKPIFSFADCHRLDIFVSLYSHYQHIYLLQEYANSWK